MNTLTYILGNTTATGIKIFLIGSVIGIILMAFARVAALIAHRYFKNQVK